MQSIQKKALVSILESAFNVLDNEAKGIYALLEEFPSSFEDVIKKISTIKGKLVVTGIGKSGHIAHKIAATFSSTGQPAFFIHPTEASHGDLGMLTNEDAVLALSNSGETRELSDIIQYTKRFQLPLISITSKKDSTLAKQSTYCLPIPDIQEACPMGLAPTTSTTMMMALGDAMAISLLQYKGFTYQDYKLFHPGGILGLKLMKVKDKMATGDALPIVSSDDTMTNALNMISQKGMGCVGIVSKNYSLTGVMTNGDLMRNISKNVLSLPITEVMTANPVTIHEDMLMAEALALLNEKKITTLFVTDDHKKPIGAIHIHDFLKAKMF